MKTQEKRIITLNSVPNIDLLLEKVSECKNSVTLIGSGMHLDLDSTLTRIFANVVLNENEANLYCLEVSGEEDYNHILQCF